MRIENGDICLLTLADACAKSGEPGLGMFIILLLIDKFSFQRLIFLIRNKPLFFQVIYFY